MGASDDEIDRQMRATRDHMDQDLDDLEQQTASSAMRYGRIAAVVLGVAVVAVAGAVIYRRMNRPSRREQLQIMLIEALKDFPDSLRDLPDEVTTRLRKSLPSVKIVVTREDVAREARTLEDIVRKVAPSVMGTASNALIGRFTRRRSDPADDRHSRSTAPAYD